MEHRPNRPLTQAELRRRANARAKRRRQIRRNRMIFALICLALVGLVVFGITSLVKKATGEPSSSSKPSSSSVASSSSASSQPASSAASDSATSGSSGASSSTAASASTSPSASPQATMADRLSAEENDWLLTLVNGNVKLPDGWDDTLETKVAEPTTGKELAAVAADAYIAMKDAAAKDGVDLLLCSGYRSVDYQSRLFEAEKQEWIAKGYSEEEAYNKAKTEVAVPGYSEHSTGLAADIVTPSHQTLDEAFGRTDAGKWLAQHAPEYGFILRYPENKQAITGIIYEPWHFRYVGVENAKAIAASGLTLEEYLDQAVNKA
ncbi:MAG: M15 family metallopeptidase [Candidatus Fournierella pullistercoris]|uniref:M15 family metallopeptidase n=1 Tax=Candidatus Allofournierella pullistercoris TaxID=2838597 RepID=A0A948T2Y0_9FIRM|nr:M15 family metallopeptidase [Candidatus Fournierella pullistercoris]